MKGLLVPAIAAAAVALAVPASPAAVPKGSGLYGEHLSHCSGVFEYGTAEDPQPVLLVPGAGNSFWVAGHHLVIQSAEITDTVTGETTPYVFGTKAGLVSGDIETCEGDFPGYHVVSHDVVVP